MDGMLPIYMKHYYKNEALFSDTKIVTSVYSQSLGTLDAEMINKLSGWFHGCWGLQIHFMKISETLTF
jgi:hypothetical protein